MAVNSSGYLILVGFGELVTETMLTECSMREINTEIIEKAIDIGHYPSAKSIKGKLKLYRLELKSRLSTVKAGGTETPTYFQN